MKIFTSRNDANLSNIIPFKEDDRWYLKLIYKYEDEKGKHTVVIPKAAIPFEQLNLPVIKPLYPSYSSYNQCFLDPPYIDCNYSMQLYNSVCDLAIERGVKEPSCYFDIITEYATKEMTLEEIEKELGYKVKIISKEKLSNAQT